MTAEDTESARRVGLAWLVRFVAITSTMTYFCFASVTFLQLWLSNAGLLSSMISGMLWYRESESAWIVYAAICGSGVLLGVVTVLVYREKE